MEEAELFLPTTNYQDAFTFTFAILFCLESIFPPPCYGSHSLDAMSASGQNTSQQREHGGCASPTKATVQFLSSVPSFSACLIFVGLFSMKWSSPVTGCCFNKNLPQTQQTTSLFIDEASDCVMKQRICDAAPPAMSDMIR